MNTTSPNLSAVVTLPMQLGKSDFGEKQITDENSKPTRKRKRKADGKVAIGRHLAPGKERCDICKRGYTQLAHHKKTSHGPLKKPIECCGINFTTRHSFRTHRESGCNFRSSHNRLSTRC